MSLLLIYLVFLCLNIGLAVTADYTGLNLGQQPLPDLGTGEGQTFAGIQAPTNSTNNNPFNFITEFTFAANQATVMIINALTFGFIIDTIDGTIPGLEMPEVFVNGLKVILGLFHALLIFYLWTGRSLQNFT